MSKNLHEKYERIISLKDRFVSLVEGQIAGDLANVDAKELGEVADIAKDMAEMMKLCSEAEYYHKITEAMEKNSDADNIGYMNKYLPEYKNNRYYYPIWNDSRQRDLDWNPYYMDGTRPYYYSPNGRNGTNGGNSTNGGNGGSNSNFANGNGDSNGNSNGSSGGRNYAEYMRDSREGRNGVSRRTYMDMKESGADKNEKVKEMKKWASDLAEDIFEMLEDASSEEKSVLKQHLNQLVSKIN